MPTLAQKIRDRLPFAKYSPDDQKIIAICFGIAFFFWLLVKLSKDYVVSEVLDLHYELPLGLAFSSEPPAQVSVELEATGWGLLATRLPARQIILRLPVNKTPVYALTPYDLEQQIGNVLGSRVAIRQLNFSTVRIPLEPRSQLRLPVKLLSRVSFADGYSLAGDMVLSPDTVTIEGPASKLHLLTHIITDSLKLEALSQSGSYRITLQAPGPGIRLFPPQVEVSIPVEQITEKELYVPVRIMNPPPADSIRIFPVQAYVKCILGLSRYKSLTPADFEITADFNKAYLKDERNSVPLELTRQPEYVRNVSYAPHAAEFFLVKRQAQE